MENDYRTILMVLVLPVLMACALSVLQMTLSLFFGSVLSFAGVCVLYVVSLFYYTPVSPINYLMIERNDIVMSDGCNTLLGLLYALLLIVISMLIGVIYMEKHDILTKS